MAKSLRVICRISPPLSADSQIRSRSSTITIKDQSFNFDAVYPESSKQSEIYTKEVDYLVKGATQGLNGCFLAFGTTQSGKSYTLRGGEGKNRGILSRSAEKLLNWIEKERSHGRNFELKMSVIQIYQDIISDLMICGSRGLEISGEESPKIDGLTEHKINRINDLFTHLRHALQMRKGLVKADSKLKTRSHFVVFLKIYENSNEVSEIAFADLAGSENASSDQNVINANSTSLEEKKSIARTFNIVSKVLTRHEGIWKECKLTGCLKAHMESNVIFCICVTSAPSLAKHTSAALKFALRIKTEAEDTNNPYILEVNRIRDDVKKIQNGQKDCTLEWINEKQGIIHQIHDELMKDTKLIASRYVHECQLLTNELEEMKIKFLAKPPKGDKNKKKKSNSKELEIRQKSEKDITQSLANVSPIAKKELFPSPPRRECLTERSRNENEDFLITDSQNHLKKIEEINFQLRDREEQITRCRKDIDYLQEINRDQEKIITEQNQRLNEGYAKVAEMSARIQEYVLRLQQVKDENSRRLLESQMKNSREELLETQINELEKQMSHERDGHRIQISQLQAAIDQKERQLLDLLSSREFINKNQPTYRETSPYRRDNSFNNIELREAQEKLQQNSRTILEFEKTIQLLQNEINEGIESRKMRNYDEAKLKSENFELARNSQELEDKLNEVTRRNEILEMKIKEFLKTGNETEVMLNQSAKKNSELQEDIGELIRFKKEFEADKNRLIEDNSKLAEELNEMIKNNEDLQEQLQNLFRNNENLQEQVRNLSRNNDMLQYEIEALRDQIEKQNQESYAFKCDLEDKKYEVDVKEKEIEDMKRSSKFEQDEILKLRIKADDLNSQIKELLIENKKLTKENRDLHENKKSLENEINNQNNKYEEALQRISRQEQKIERLQTQSPISSGNASSYEIKKLTKKIKKLKKERQELQDKLNRGSKMTDERMMELIRERDSAVQELNMCRDEQVNELTIVENQIDVIEQELIKLKEQNAVLINREQEIMKELKKSEDLKEKYVGKVEKLKEERESYKNYIAEAENYIKELVEKQQKVTKSSILTDDRGQAVSSRLRALEDIKNLIKAHKHQ
ncbi:unnamed protein product [Blepharisma stoltei]|uniref:Kinesin motor domain-containing protein n=1 Tax=Blepharisma stoltei TaxID=1481888 RepID=A0AAU9IWX7_9CILI|nr:unnamed protein product [Blepharisma stoltei]